MQPNGVAAVGGGGRYDRPGETHTGGLGEPPWGVSSLAQFASEADVCGKFTKLCSQVLPAAGVAELQDAVMHLEEVKDIRTLAGLLTLPG